MPPSKCKYLPLVLCVVFATTLSHAVESDGKKCVFSQLVPAAVTGQSGLETGLSADSASNHVPSKEELARLEQQIDSAADAATVKFLTDDLARYAKNLSAKEMAAVRQRIIDLNMKLFHKPLKGQGGRQLDIARALLPHLSSWEQDFKTLVDNMLTPVPGRDMEARIFGIRALVNAAKDEETRSEFLNRTVELFDDKRVEVKIEATNAYFELGGEDKPEIWKKMKRLLKPLLEQDYALKAIKGESNWAYARQKAMVAQAAQFRAVEFFEKYRQKLEPDISRPDWFYSEASPYQETEVTRRGGNFLNTQHQEHQQQLRLAPPAGLSPQPNPRIGNVGQ